MTGSQHEQLLNGDNELTTLPDLCINGSMYLVIDNFMVRNFNIISLHTVLFLKKRSLIISITRAVNFKFSAAITDENVIVRCQCFEVLWSAIGDSADITPGESFLQ